MGSIASLWSGTRPDRAELEPCSICEVADGECRDGFTHAGRRWEIGITWPGNTFGSTVGCSTGCAGRRSRTATSPRTDDDYSPRYRGACTGCGWASEFDYDDSNEALEDALDHVLPEWRRVPVIEPLSHDANAKQLDRWLSQHGDLHATLGLDERYTPAAGGVIRTMRQPTGTRSHWSNGFFEVCAGVVVVERVEPVRAEELGLF